MTRSFPLDRAVALLLLGLLVASFGSLCRGNKPWPHYFGPGGGSCWTTTCGSFGGRRPRSAGTVSGTSISPALDRQGGLDRRCAVCRRRLSAAAAAAASLADLPTASATTDGSRPPGRRLATSRRLAVARDLRGGGQYLIPAGWNPFGYKITALGEEFLSYDGSLDSDVGRFLASLKKERKRFATLKGQWLEILRVSKSGQSIRIYKNLHELLQFCLKAGLVD